MAHYVVEDRMGKKAKIDAVPFHDFCKQLKEGRVSTDPKKRLAQLDMYRSTHGQEFKGIGVLKDWVLAD